LPNTSDVDAAGEYHSRRIVLLSPGRRLLTLSTKILSASALSWGRRSTGEIDPIEEINDLLVEVKNTRDGDIPIHVDAAIGGFILPFTQPELRWDFQTVPSEINQRVRPTSTAWLPRPWWLIFRDTTDLPEDLVFYVNYLGDEMPSYTLNFSRGSGMLLAQYYNCSGWLGGVAMARQGSPGTRPIPDQAALGHRYFDILNGAESFPSYVPAQKTSRFLRV